MTALGKDQNSINEFFVVLTASEKGSEILIS